MSHRKKEPFLNMELTAAEMNDRFFNEQSTICEVDSVIYTMQLFRKCK